MVLKVYNTATRKKEVFKPLKEGVVNMYVCGVTPYDLSHVGHARSYIAFDVIRRSLEYLGYHVNYVQNFTDIDDKIIDRAKELGIHPLELSKKNIEEYFEDMDALGVKRADSYPKVSEKIPQIIETVQKLIDKGAAYEADGNVYLDVAKKEGYGKFSGQSIDELKAGSRVIVDKKKRNPLDFALWKKAKPDEISWESPWGRGRPGWHIECSTMSMELLGSTLDIHGGGQDLIFPHHENEIAQSESLTGKPFARYWLHNGLVTVDGQKMSKSLGNFKTIKDLMEKFNPQTIRYFLLSAHYRSSLDFSRRAVRDADKGRMRIQNTILNITNALGYGKVQKSDGFKKNVSIAKTSFVRAVEDDFNIPKALSALFNLIKDVNTYLEENPVQSSLVQTLTEIKEMTGVLGLKFKDDLPPFEKDLIQLIIRLRERLREKKDYKSADKIREELLKIGIVLEDKKDRTVWKFTVSLEAQQ